MGGFVLEQQEVEQEPTAASDEPVRLGGTAFVGRHVPSNQSGQAAPPRAKLAIAWRRPPPHKPTFNHQLLRKYSPRLDELRQKPLLSPEERRPSSILNCDSPETPKAKKLKRLQESAEPLLRLRDERQQHFAAACPAAKMQSEVRSKLDERS